MKPGPKPGSVKTPETKERMRQAKLGTSHTLETREKISKSMSNVPKEESHKDKISWSRTEQSDKFLKRFEELRSEYPEHSTFFDNNKAALLGMMGEVISEQELTQLRKNIEISSVESNLSYNYPSTSVFAVEDLLIDLLDFKRELFRTLGEFDKIDVRH